MKKQTEKSIREFLAPLDLQPYEVHPSGLIVPVEFCDGFEASLYADSPLAVLSEDVFSDAFHHTLENHIPELLLAAFEDASAKIGGPLIPLRDTVALAIDCIDWSAFEDECDDAMIITLMTDSGEVLDYTKKDGFMCVVKPSGNLITSLIHLHRKAHDKWLLKSNYPFARSA